MVWIPGRGRVNFRRKCFFLSLHFGLGGLPHGDRPSEPAPAAPPTPAALQVRLNVRSLLLPSHLDLLRAVFSGTSSPLAGRRSLHLRYN